MLVDYDFSSLVIDTLCKQAVDENAAVACFYFGFATQEEQSLAEILSSVLKQVVDGLNEVPQTTVKAFRNRRRVIGGQRLALAKLWSSRRIYSPNAHLYALTSRRVSGETAGEALGLTQPNPPKVPRHANISDRETTYPGRS